MSYPWWELTETIDCELLWKTCTDSQKSTFLLVNVAKVLHFGRSIISGRKLAAVLTDLETVVLYTRAKWKKVKCQLEKQEDGDL